MMTGRQLAALAIRMLAIYCVVLAITNSSQIALYLGYVFQWFTPPDSGHIIEFQEPMNLWTVVFMALPSLTQLLIGILLWRFSARIAVRMVGDQEETSLPLLALDSFAIHVIAFSTVGILLIAKVLPTIVKFVFYFLTEGQQIPYGLRSSMGQLDVLTAFIQLIFGLGLIFGAQGIVKSIHAVRDIKNLGRDPSFPSDNPPTSQP